MRTKTASTAGAVALTAAALTAGISSPGTLTSNAEVRLAAAAASYYQVDTTLTGPLTGLAAGLGLLPDSFSIDTFQTTLNFKWTDSQASNMYNTLNKIPMQPTGNLICGDGSSYGGKCRMALTIADTSGVYGAADAFRAFWSTAQGNNLGPGFPPITEAGLTSIVQVLLNNPLRPNGGSAARLAPLMQLLGVDPTLPPTGTEKVSGLTKSGLAQSLIDLTWEYNPTGDAPVTMNPFSQLNSFFANLPPLGLLDLVTGGAAITDLLTELYVTKGIGGDTVYPGTEAAAYIGGVALLYLAGDPAALLPEQNLKTFITLANPDVPLLTPLRLPGVLTNLLLKRINSPYLLGNPVADALNPMLKILVNIGYPDVITPAGLANNPALAEAGFSAYDRTFSQTAVPVQLGSIDPLTPADKKALPGDLWNALVGGIKAQLEKPFWGILVPNTPTPPPGSSAPAATIPAAQAVPPKPAAATAVVAATPVVTETASETPAAVTAPAVDDPAPAVTAPSPISIPTSLSTDADPGPTAPSAPARRGGGPSSATLGNSASSAGQGASGTGHRGPRG